MIINELFELADSLDTKKHFKLANALDDILKRHAMEMAEEVDEDAAEDGEVVQMEGEIEEVSDEPPADMGGEEMAPAAPEAPVADGQDMDQAYSDQGGGEDLPGMLGDSWYGEGPQWDLTPADQGEFAGTMVDDSTPLPGDAGDAGGAPDMMAAPEPAAEEAVEEEPAEEPAAEEAVEEEPAEDEGEEEAADEEDDDDESEEDIADAAMKLAELASKFDKSGRVKEAALIDSILADMAARK